ncbi:phosphotransferase family protein [Kitasatospora sp. NPDC101183]|uniref:phosphotransferase family protein n=1 Tax=Kitasatospora sp. NPDC101183 TaxID=3364100 RepID=UPI0038256DEF
MAGTTTAPLRAACALAGLPSEGATLIREGENALWRLPGGVVARIGRTGQAAAAARELAVARWLFENRFPAVRPLESVPQPLDVDGRPVTFWHQLPPHAHGTAVDLAPLLRRLHRLPVPALELGRLDPFVRLGLRIDGASTLDPPERAWLRERLAVLRGAWSGLPPGMPLGVVHGDAWGGNVAVTASTTYLLDFERTSLGPPEWDLAAVAVEQGVFDTTGPEEYAAFCEAYGTDVTAWAGYPVLRDLRELRLTCYALQLAAADPDRHRAEAHHRLACLRGEKGPRPWHWTAVS